MWRALALMFLVGLLGCNSIGKWTHTPTDYYLCTEVDLVKGIYTFRHVSETKGYSTLIKAQVEGIYIANLSAMEPPGNLPAFCWAGQRWDPRDWERPNERYFRVRNVSDGKASWHPQFAVLSETLEAPKTKNQSD